MSNSIDSGLKILANTGSLSLAQSMRRGIEKEALRVTPTGHLSQMPHPAALGAKLTHPHITTDFSEALLELITPALSSSVELQHWLQALHAVIYPHIGDELLWPASMPCRLNGAAQIPIAQFGQSHVGQMKTIYRHGLSHRYGKNMQTISGMHFNLSYPNHLWEVRHQAEQSLMPLRHYIDNQYMGLIRNFLRFEPVIIYLFGASPAIDKSFDATNRLHLKQHATRTFIQPHATSLRMSNIGYHNQIQSNLNVSYNSLDAYINDLYRATSQLDPQYKIINDDDDKQLSQCILQIEAEYYGPIRPKRVTQSGERPLAALSQRGIEYIEVRALDINPYEWTGMSTHQIHFLECFLLFCLLHPSDPIGTNEAHWLRENHSNIVHLGRCEQMTMLDTRGKMVSWQDWLANFWPDLVCVARYLDTIGPSNAYQAALEYSAVQLADPTKTPSGRMVAALKSRQDDYVTYIQQQAIAQRTYFQALNKHPTLIKQLMAHVEPSHAEQRTIEREQTGTLEDHIARYLANPRSS